MAEPKEPKYKLYYSIGEVAEMLGVNDTLLRFWEREFPQISPKKGGRGVRQYTKDDIETIKVIYNLVKSARPPHRSRSRSTSQKQGR